MEIWKKLWVGVFSEHSVYEIAYELHWRSHTDDQWSVCQLSCHCIAASNVELVGIVQPLRLSEVLSTRSFPGVCHS